MRRTSAFQSIPLFWERTLLVEGALNAPGPRVNAFAGRDGVGVDEDRGQHCTGPSFVGVEVSRQIAIGQQDVAGASTRTSFSICSRNISASMTAPRHEGGALLSLARRLDATENCGP